MSYTKSSSAAALASAAALFAASAFAATPPAGSAGLRVRGERQGRMCYGVHDCKGNADCKTSENACKGQNAWEGHSFKGMSAAECLGKSGTIGDLKAK